MRRRNLIGAAEMPYRLPRLEPGGAGGRYRMRQRRLSRGARTLPCRVRLGGKARVAGPRDRRPLSRRRRRLLYRGRRRRAEGDGAARTRGGRHGVGLCRLGRGRAGPRNGDGADRRRHARPAARAGARVPRLDPLSRRGLRRVRVALDRSRRLGGVRGRRRPCSKRSGPPPPRGLACAAEQIELVDGRARAQRRTLARLRRAGGGRAAGRRQPSPTTTG